eukprot:TRINITY_DN7157_c0_g2_i6.p1 TRINITY_DN7157_c0_g2~~TRINITY_DN7157_c0_g2_i6.p1  ORF type:complete len:104 (+),score=9.49 TRINITY_DN7157_c0_g2_i6:124-435(+)
MMSSPSTPPHISSSWSWLSPRRPRHDEEQGSFAELSDENDAIAIAIPIPLPTETEQQGASQIQGAAPQNSCNNYMPLNASELGSDIMSYAVPVRLNFYVYLQS